MLEMGVLYSYSHLNVYIHDKRDHQAKEQWPRLSSSKLLASFLEGNDSTRIRHENKQTWKDPKF